jgi:hypothetical protein
MYVSLAFFRLFYIIERVFIPKKACTTSVGVTNTNGFPANERKIIFFFFKIECLEYNDQTDIIIRKSIKKSSSNQCPLEFLHKVRVQCSKPHAIELSKLFNITQMDIFNKLPTCTLNKIAYANIENRVNVLVKVKNINGDYFDNFTSSTSQIEWKFNNNHMESNGYLNSIEIDNRLGYYQNFFTKNLVGESELEASLIGFFGIGVNGHLKMIFVDYVEVIPNGITIFNHPSNIAKLNVFNGSGYFFADFEDNGLMKVEMSENFKQIQIQPNNIGNTQMNVYDYCAFDENHIENIQINIVGINSIQATLNDTKVELNRNLLLKVRITDEYGNYIKKSLFRFFNLKYKLANENSYAFIHHIEQDSDEQSDDLTEIYLFKGIKIGTFDCL